MSVLFKCSILLIFVLLCRADPSGESLTDFLKDFARGPEKYLGKIGTRIKAHIVKEMLKFTLADYLDNNPTGGLNLTRANFQNFMPFFTFFRRMNLTNHTVGELEEMVVDAIPVEFDKKSLAKIKENSTEWESFSDKFIANLLKRFTGGNATNLEFFEQVYDKLKGFYEVANSSSNLTDHLDKLGAFTPETLSSKEKMGNLAKNLHKNLKDQGKKYSQTDVQKEQATTSSSTHWILGIILGVILIGLVVLLILLVRRYYLTKFKGAYAQMEASHSLTA